MLGAIIGDIVGSRFEFHNTDKYNFGKLFTKQCDFTDDTICTVAIAHAILKADYNYKDALLYWCRKYPNPMGSYGGSFARWINSEDPQPYNSFGNGAAMRVSPVAFAWSTSADVIREAIATASVSHNHPEGIKGAMATALATFALRKSHNKETAIRIEQLFYDLNAKYTRGRFDETCQGTVPVALRIISESCDFEDAIRMAMAWGGDSDTLGAIVGGMAEALYGIPSDIKAAAMEYLPADMRIVINEFYDAFVHD